jgi:hypothetical protein
MIEIVWLNGSFPVPFLGEYGQCTDLHNILEREVKVDSV